MARYRCMVVDDNAEDIDILKSLIQQFEQLYLISSYVEPKLALRDISQLAIDILFLDVEMPGLSGVEFARIKPENTKVIFTTAFKVYGYDAFEQDVVAYLLKPFDIIKFDRAVKKAIQQIELTNNQEEIYRGRRIDIRVKHKHANEYNIEHIYEKQIFYIESDRDYIKIYTSKQIQFYYIRSTLSEFYQYLNEDLFVQMNRSTVVNIEHIIKRIKNRIFILTNGAEINLSENYIDEFLNKVDLKG